MPLRISRQGFEAFQNLGAIEAESALVDGKDSAALELFRDGDNDMQDIQATLAIHARGRIRVCLEDARGGFLCYEWHALWQ
jgi:hypothetical protein